MLVFERCLFKRIYRIWAELPVPAGGSAGAGSRHELGSDCLTFQHHAILTQMDDSAGKVGRRGTVVLPAKLRRRLGIEEGSFVVAEAREDGILIRPAAVLPVEIYSPERRAEFLLNNAVDAADYRRARAEVKRIGLDPDRIRHHPPAKRRTRDASS